MAANRFSQQPPWVTIWQRLFQPSAFLQEVGIRRQAQLIAAISFIFALMNLTGAIASYLSTREIAAALVLIALALFSTVGYAVARTRYYHVGGYLIVWLLTASAFTNPSGAETISNSLYVYLIPAIVFASISFPFRYMVFYTIFCNIAIPVLPFFYPQYTNIGFDIAVFLPFSVLILSSIRYRDNVERDRLAEVKVINRELEELTTHLEQRVEERTGELEKANQQTSRRATQLQTVTELSASIAQLQELSELFPAVVRLISERFGFYHVGIFLIDGDHEYAILQAANSEGGQRLLARGHRLKLGTGVVGFAAQSGQPRIALDVGADAVFFDNPDLPNTRSEVALPMKSRNVTIGVLDAQSTEPGAFSPEDLQVLITLANQVSIALENTRLFTETRAALRQVQEVYDEFTRAEWSRTVALAEQPGFRYQMGRIEMLEDQLKSPEVISAVQNGEALSTSAQKDKSPIVVVPVKLRGEVIGVIHVESNDPQKNWLEDEVSLVEAVAERAAFAMENARLFQDARRRAAKESMISEATARISSALNIENILRTTAEELEHVLGGSEVLIQFQSKENS